jgi:multidrug efflux pump subunit AcrA (membrane-fusion protein)
MVEVAFEKTREVANRATAYLLERERVGGMSRSAARVLLTGAIGVVLLLAACSAPATTAPSASPAVAVAVAEATQGVIQQTLSYSGELRAPAQVSIVAKVGGAIQQLTVGVGSHVTAGDVLAVLDPANAQARVTPISGGGQPGPGKARQH